MAPKNNTLRTIKVVSPLSCAYSEVSMGKGRVLEHKAQEGPFPLRVLQESMELHRDTVAMVGGPWFFTLEIEIGRWSCGNFHLCL
jgi:hypothetical protein